MHDQEKITHYFLGELSSEEAQLLEYECFSDNAFAESVFVVEEDLIDRYVRDELSPDELERFERFYLTTGARRSRVELARALSQTMNSATKLPEHSNRFESHDFWQQLSPNRAWPRYALATVIMALVVLSVWLLIRNSNQEQITQINPPINIATPENGRAPLSSPSPTESLSPKNVTPAGPGPTPQLAIVVFTLLPGTSREGDASERVIRLSPQTEMIEIRFVLLDPVQGPYEIRIENVEGERVIRRRNVRAVAVNGRHILVVRTPASAFEARDYIGRLLVPNGDAAASYTFRVNKTK